jgi:hypothetical protein
MCGVYSNMPHDVNSDCLIVMAFSLKFLRLFPLYWLRHFRDAWQNTLHLRALEIAFVHKPESPLKRIYRIQRHERIY